MGKYIKKKFIFLCLIVLLAAFLRIYRLGDVPVGFHRDEAFLGYNAYSILMTGRDVNGNFLPLHLASFLYSPAGYSYLAIPFIKLFGLTEFAVRFPSALFGLLTVPITYLLVKKIFDSNNLALASSFLLSFSPWHINLSRTATENTVVVFFITLGVMLWFVWLENKKLPFLWAAFFSFMITLIMYQASRAFLPFFIPFFILLVYKWRQKKEIILTFFLFSIVVVVPLFFILSSPTLSMRLRMLSIFGADQQTRLVLTEQIHGDGVANIPIVISRVYHNKLIGYTNQFLQNYFSHFSYDFFFSDKGYPDRYRIPNNGLLYIFELPLLLLGVWKMVKIWPKQAVLLSGWIAIAPIGSALTFDDIPNLQRTLLVFPALSIITAFGLVEFLQFIYARKLKSFFLTVSVIILFYCVSYYLHQYYIHSPVYKPWFRNDGYKTLVAKISSLSPKYKKIAVTSRETDPTIFFLFFTKYDPAEFHKETKNKNLTNFNRVWFSKYEFSNEECPLERQNGEKGILYVNSSLCQQQSGAVFIDVIKRGDGAEVFHLLEVL